MSLSPHDFKTLVRILGGWFGWRNERDRQVFLEEALRPSTRADDIIGQLDLSGNPHNSAVHTVILLDRFGQDIGGSAGFKVLCLLIEALKRKVGNSDRAELEAISSRLNCPATDAETDSVEQPSADLQIRDRSRTSNVMESNTRQGARSEEHTQSTSQSTSVADVRTHDQATHQGPKNDEYPPPWNLPVILGLILALIGSVAAVLALVPEAQRASWLATMGFNSTFTAETSDMATLTVSTLVTTDSREGTLVGGAVPRTEQSTILPVPSELPPCPIGEGPNGFRAGYYNPYRLTDEERSWMWQAWGFEGQPSVSWGGLPCGRDYGSSDLNFYAMVCARGRVGPEGYRPGSYDPQTLPQSVRQFLWDEFREDGGQGGGIAPVGYGGQTCPSN